MPHTVERLASLPIYMPKIPSARECLDKIDAERRWDNPGFKHWNNFRVESIVTFTNADTGEPLGVRFNYTYGEFNSNFRTSDF